VDDETISQINSRFDHIERALKTISPNGYTTWAEAQNVDPSSGIPLEIIELVRSGNKLRALARYRELMGCGLSETNSAIDSIARS